jgi:hypothetical protein
MDNPGIDLAGAGAPAPDWAELRGAERYALLIRTAKLVCDAGEFFCVVRDISATGLRLKLFHPLPPGSGFTIELANGSAYALDRVWEANGEAGFRFASAIDVPEFIEERSPYPRRPVRLRLPLAAVLTADGVASAVRLSDLSQQGARIETDRHLALQQKVKLEARGLPLVTGSVCWRSTPHYGVVFQQRFSFDELARIAARLQLGGQGAAGLTPDGKPTRPR